MRRDGSGQHRLTNTLASETEPDWSPDGQRIVFRSFGGNEASALYTMPVRGGKRMRLTRSSTNEVNPAWSPDGYRIAFQRNDGKTEIGVLDLRTRKTKIIAEGASPAWSPDGRRIAYAATREGQTELFVIGSGGGRWEQVTTTGGENPSWSRDGRKLAFDWAGQIFTVNVDSTSLRQVTRPGSGLNIEPDW
jgi:TolB protein